MKLEIFEKIGEMNITQVRTAEENNAIASAEKARLAELAELKKQQELKEKAPIIIQSLMEKINQTAEKGGNSLTLEWTEKIPRFHGITWQEWSALGEKIIPSFEKLGYHIYIHWYSPAWRTKTGKIGYTYISW